MRTIIRLNNVRTLAWTYALAIGAGALVGLVGGCSDGERASGTLTVHVSDAPYPFDVMTAAEITIDRVEVRILGDDERESGFYVLVDEPRTLNLLELRGGVTEVLAEAEVPAGQLEQIRLEIARGHVTLADGREFDLAVPSGEASGIKLFPYPEARLDAGMAAELLLDVDVAQSFAAIPAAPGQSSDIRGFMFRPTLRAANLAGTGTISGRVRGDAGTPGDPADDVPLADADVRVDGSSSFHTASDGRGEWRILGVPAGSYVVTAAAASHEGAEVEAFVVVASDASGNDLVLRRD
jgi:hypothetical protein